MDKTVNIMTLDRFLKALSSWNRLGEIYNCFKLSKAPFRETLAFLQVISLEYPYRFRLKTGHSLDLMEWGDLGTIWVVFFGDEYILNDKDRTIVDLGGNIGAFALLATIETNDADIVSIEPYPENYKRLLESILQNQLKDRVRCLNVAVVGKPRTVWMNDSSNILGSGRAIGGHEGVRVEGIDLATVMSRMQIEKIDYLKVDIEGSEYELFEEIPKSVLARIGRIGVEYHDNGSRKNLFKNITDCGFELSRHPKAGSYGLAEFRNISLQN